METITYKYTAQLWTPRWLPSYANKFMGKFEKQLLESSIVSWYRLIDDVEMKLLSPANNLHPSIKFTHEIYNAAISFRDTSSSLTEGEQSTDLYFKPTDTNQYIVA